MSADITVFACLALGLCSALVAGVFQSFSDFIMRSLAAAHPAAGIEAMQWINRKVYRSFFLVMLLGLAPAAIGFAVFAHVTLTGMERNWIFAGAATYLVAVFGITMLGNVPMNNRLDRVNRSTAEAVTYWRTYARTWTRFNHVRTIGSVVTAVCFLLGAMEAA